MVILACFQDFFFLVLSSLLVKSIEEVTLPEPLVSRLQELKAYNCDSTQFCSWVSGVLSDLSVLPSEPQVELAVKFLSVENLRSLRSPNARLIASWIMTLTSWSVGPFRLSHFCFAPVTEAFFSLAIKP